MLTIDIILADKYINMPVMLGLSVCSNLST